MVLFTSDRPLQRAENIKAVFDAYDGEKEFIQTDPYRYNPEVSSEKYSLRVADEFIYSSPGKAIMIGHAICGGKTFGLDQPKPYYRRENARFLTYVISSSEATRDLVATQCCVSINDVLPYGMPRTDAYFGMHKGDGKTALAKKRSYLFAPTWRSKGEGAMPEIDWQRIDSQLLDGELMVVKPHMNSGRLLKREYRHITEVSPDLPSTPYLVDCDVLITDYSSILFDAHILNKPVVLFEKEKGYTETRGMYLKYPEGYASRYATSEEELVEVIRAAYEPREADRICREYTAGACDGHSTERIIRLIREVA